MSVLRAATASAEGTQSIAGAVASVSRPGDMILLAGDLGTGKTTFTQGFGRAIGVDVPITSPTFTLVNHYPANGLTLIHADVYRLERLQEIVDLGLGELVDDDAMAIVEWGDVAEPVLPRDFLEVTIAYPDVEESDDEPDDDEIDERRTFVLRMVGPSWISRAPSLAAAIAAVTVADDAGGLS